MQRSISFDSFPVTKMWKIHLFILDLDEDFLRPPRDISTQAGQEVRLECRPPAAYPEVTVHWYKGLTPVWLRGGEFAISMTTSGDVIFHNVQLPDEGEYHCLAVNTFAEPQSRSSRVITLAINSMCDKDLKCLLFLINVMQSCKHTVVPMI